MMFLVITLFLFFLRFERFMSPQQRYVVAAYACLIEIDREIEMP